MEDVDRRNCGLLWESDEFDFASKPSEGRSGGILTIWDRRAFSATSIQMYDSILWLEGEYGEEEKRVIIVNTYAPCDTRRKRELWRCLSERIQEKNGDRICIAGDFNAIRYEEERTGANDNSKREDIKGFNEFILSSDLVNFPLHGRNFTWSRSGSTIMSRLDRFLIAEEWFGSWPTSTQWELDKGLSDHCPILLGGSSQSWGSKPFRMLNCWKYLDGYNDFIREQWLNMKIDGWGVYVLKEKLKLIKGKLKDWHKQHTQNLEGKIKSAKEELNLLEVKGESSTLSTMEIDRKREVYLNLHKLMYLNCSIQCQRARIKWGLFEGRGVRPIPSNMFFQKMEEGDRDRLVQEF
ncbi:uncharacterized protein LOC131635950 [Vicia villosa]|uniref:uncharacterized protein LOC131635950 n=1 Tax=Vicia villosa TaxID=3911 RepID=UPI00273CCECA|nr:uncharacterized protein LOC131635950 [Vicia villosa]